jgi:hypothetical protein
MVFNKFIVEGDALIIGRVTYHRELADKHEEVLGGGMYNLDYENKTFTLFGSSQDFGSVSFETLKKVVLSGEIYTNKYKIRKLEGYSFIYQDEMYEKTEIK